jgi:diacylglycerol O-acyltransferase / wax synthase
VAEEREAQLTEAPGAVARATASPVRGPAAVLAGVRSGWDVLAGVRSGWDVLAGLAVFGLYLAVAQRTAGHVRAADGHARAIDAAERWLRLPSEQAVNAWTVRHSLFVVAANYHYAVGYLATTLGVLAWLRLAHRPAYAGRAVCLLAVNLVAIGAFLAYPASPPRLLAATGFVDTVARHGTVGSWGTGLISSTANQHAAMPSLHVAWAAWVAVTLLHEPVPRWLQRAGVLHIGTTTAAIVMTGNHWLLDAVAGLGVVAGVELAVAAGGRVLNAGWPWPSSSR